jgi:hypothetical protein
MISYTCGTPQRAHIRVQPHRIPRNLRVPLLSLQTREAVHTLPILLYLLEPTHPMLPTRARIPKRNIPPILRLCKDQLDFVLGVLVCIAELDGADSKVVLGPWLEGAAVADDMHPAAFGI